MDKAIAYDVFKKTPQKSALWLGTVNGLQRAIEQMKRMAARLPGDYYVSNTATDEVLASIHSETLPESGAQDHNDSNLFLKSP